MNAPGEASGDRSAPDTASPPANLPAGYVVGEKYVIKRLLGEGASGSVYEGEHSQIGHRVAIKVVHKALAKSEAIVARFTREARICGTIRNRNVGQVYDVGELPNGAPYMVMELHEGRSLAKLLIETGPLPFAVVLDIAEQLLRGLQAAHDCAVVHRDVKPDNIMIVRESSGHMLVKLVDFGIGKTLDADISARKVTQDGVMIGSPDYMSPEALRGEEVDARADLYAVGVVLYEMVTGRVPFDAGSMTELFVAILRDPVPPPRELRPDCPAQLERVIEKAMRRDSLKRYRHASEMRDALARARRECGYSVDVLTRFSLQPTAAAASSAQPDLRGAGVLETERVMTAELKLPVKRTATRLVIGGAVLAIIAGAAIALWPAQREQPANELKPLPPAPRMAATPPNDTATAPAAPSTIAPAEPEPTITPDIAATPEHGEPAAMGGKLADKRGPRTEAAAAPPGPTRAKPRVPTESAPPAVNPAPADAPPAANLTGLLQQAAAAFVRGQTPRARALYREATELAPGSAEAWRGLGMVSSRMGERGEAARALKHYLSLRPNAPDATAIEKKLQELSAAR